MNKAYVLSVYDWREQRIDILGVFTSYESAEEYGFGLKRFDKRAPTFCNKGIYDIGDNDFLFIDEFEVKE